MDVRRSAPTRLSRHLTRLALGLASILTLIVAFAVPAGAVPQEIRLGVLAGWTQPTADSRLSWTAANADQGAWVEYAFDWTTDLCTFSPDNPLGFGFDMSCARHDFGYRNFRLEGLFAENRDRVDEAFYADMSAVCAGESWWAQPACYSLAWTYYQAVREFGSLDAVKQDDLDRARAMLAKGRAMAAAG